MSHDPLVSECPGHEWEVSLEGAKLPGIRALLGFPSGFYWAAFMRCTRCGEIIGTSRPAKGVDRNNAAEVVVEGGRGVNGGRPGTDTFVSGTPGGKTGLPPRGRKEDAIAFSLFSPTEIQALKNLLADPKAFVRMNS